MKKMKFVYQDNDTTKVVKGIILSEDEFTYTIKTNVNTVVVGKRNLVSAVEVQ